MQPWSSFRKLRADLALVVVRGDDTHVVALARRVVLVGLVGLGARRRVRQARVRVRRADHRDRHLVDSGISIPAQPELYVPMTTTTSSLPAYERAFSEHFASSHFPAAAVESSFDSKVIVEVARLVARLLEHELDAADHLLGLHAIRPLQRQVGHDLERSPPPPRRRRHTPLRRARRRQPAGRAGPVLPTSTQTAPPNVRHDTPNGTVPGGRRSPRAGKYHRSPRAVRDNRVAVRSAARRCDDRRLGRDGCPRDEARPRSIRGEPTIGPRAATGSPFASKPYEPSKPPDTVVAKSARRSPARLPSEPASASSRSAVASAPCKRVGVDRRPAQAFGREPPREAARMRAERAKRHAGRDDVHPAPHAPAPSSSDCSAKPSGAISFTLPRFVPSTATFSRISRAPSFDATPASRIASASLRATSRNSGA